MAKVKVNYKQLERLQRRISKFAQVDLDAFCEAMAKELAARMLAKVIKRTPVGEYTDGRVGGNLRRGWTASSEREAELSATFGGGTGASKFAQSLTVKKSGNNYEIEITNPVSYASYVEYGHRTRNLKGWVPGRFMMTISADELEQQAPAIIERKLKAKLMEVFK
ncbi:HK97 gp10 family phage protein [Lysinibacillus louembei]|uniref:HK97 gp10 family phage protein n=1 Tax=Lysinibacillus louembei TaxID=1470088 RepID=A0ABZ0RVG8_9BACI|nr:HK97 gp10 family phage protein [Lysinibacillus louembei]WPK12238.1 HK97 gp10 family phage protein [Lysinibacillus louembei]